MKCAFDTCQEDGSEPIIVRVNGEDKRLFVCSPHLYQLHHPRALDVTIGHTMKDSVSNFAAVGAFHVRFGLPNVHTDGVEPEHISLELQQFRLRFLREEVEELQRAYDNRDLPGIADALVDLVYVALGTAQLHGLPWQELFEEVQRANMCKERCGIDHVFRPWHEDGVTSNECSYRDQDGHYCKKPKIAHSLRGSAHDVIKPEGWTPPDVAGVLRRFGWEESNERR